MILLTGHDHAGTCIEGHSPGALHAWLAGHSSGIIEAGHGSSGTRFAGTFSTKLAGQGGSGTLKLGNSSSGTVLEAGSANSGAIIKAGQASSGTCIEGILAEV